MQRCSADRDFSGYNAAQARRPVRPLALAAVNAHRAGRSLGVAGQHRAGEGRPTGEGRLTGEGRPAEEEPRTAVELGCGWGIETRFLAENGYTVHAYDIDPSVSPALEDLAAELPVHPVIGDLADLEVLPDADLLLACASLPFVPRESFEPLWRRMLAALRPQGILAIDLFGEHDDWAATEGTYLSRPEVEALLAGLEVLELGEEERDGASFGGPKHWHTFRVLARRP